MNLIQKETSFRQTSHSYWYLWGSKSSVIFVGIRVFGYGDEFLMSSVCVFKGDLQGDDLRNGGLRRNPIWL